MTTVVIVLLLVALVASLAALIMTRRGQAQPKGSDPYTYIEGLRALLRNQDEQAFIKLKETVTADTNNIDAYIHLGDIFRRRKQADKALQVHRDLTLRTNLTGAEKLEILGALYRDFVELKDDASAIRAASEILQINPNDRFALEAVLSAHVQAREWKEAAIVRKKLDKLNGQDSSKMLALYKTFEGQDLEAQGDPHRARLFFKEAIHFDKNCLAAYIAVGDSYYNEKRLEDAIRYWFKIISLKPDQGHLVFERLKKGYFEVGRYGEYADTLTQLLQASPDHLTARLELAYFLEKKGELEAAREHFTTAVDTHPESMLAKLGLYRLNRSANSREAAEAVFKRIMKRAVKMEAQNFRCGSCGLDSDNMVWLCPRCKAVDSFEPIA